MTITKQDYLQKVLETHRMAHIDVLLSKYQDKRDEVKEAMEKEYTNSIYTPTNSGSYAKSTAINSKFDLDIIVPYKRNSFSTLEKMFNNVFDFLDRKYREVATVRKQKVSIGIEFFEDEDRDIVNIDIVPGRELNQDQYLNDKDLNLLFNDQTSFLTKNTYIKTNIQAQIDHIKSKENERKIIRLLKIWKSSNSEPYKSFLVELITIKAFDVNNVSGNLWEKLKFVLEYIRDNITKDGFQLIDPGNGNNNLMDTLETWDRENLSGRMNTILERIEENEDNIKSYFPTNDEFEESDLSYGIKESIITTSYPPKNQRFG